MLPQIRGRVVLTGIVDPINLLEPRIELAVSGPGMNFREVEAVVDTGFNGWLTLTPDLIDELNLTRYGTRSSIIADGRIVETGIYGALVSWGGQLRPIFVHQLESGRPLVGTSMLENSRLVVDIRPDGLVTIQAIP